MIFKQWAGYAQRLRSLVENNQKVSSASCFIPCLTSFGMALLLLVSITFTPVFAEAVEDSKGAKNAGGEKKIVEVKKAGKEEAGKPVAPTGVEVKVNAGEVTISWKKHETAKNYAIYYGLNERMSKVEDRAIGNIPQSDNPSYVFKELMPNQKYYFAVTAWGEHNTESELSEIKPLKTPPAPPSDIRAKLIGGDVVVTWEKNEGATGHKIYFMEDGNCSDGKLEGKNVHLATDSPVVVKDFSPDAKYCYFVTALSGSGEEGKPSAEHKYAPPPASPKNVNVVGLQGGARIEWDGVEKAKSYKLYYYPGESKDKGVVVSIVDPDKVLDASADAPAARFFYNQFPLNKGKYSFAISAVGDGWESAQSKIQEVETAKKNSAFKYFFLSGYEYTNGDAFAAGSTYLQLTANTMWIDVGKNGYECSGDKGSFCKNHPFFFKFASNTYFDFRLTQLTVRPDADPTHNRNLRVFFAGVGSEKRYSVTSDESGDYFIAPLAKYGIYSTDSLADTKIYQRWAAGLRFGGTEKIDPKDPHNNPALKNYVDICFGQFQHVDLDRWKVSIEGFLRPDEYPLFLSFASITDLPFQRNEDIAKDEFRIRLGVEFDMGKFVKFATKGGVFFAE